MHATPQAQVGLRATMLDDHVALEASFDRLLAACRADSREEAAAEWAALDGRLDRHLGFEERVMFPAFAKVDAYEVDALLQEHARIRKLAAQLGVEVDLHLLRLSHADEFVQLMRAHAQREGRLMYRWAESNLRRLTAGRATRYLGWLEPQRHH